ncbi:hypothetical protein FD06_GL000066 [Apilactobacillus ozensis DSM 23829 = JCM 17196]|uniref:DUF7671 domain-containing protein n=1 Tax=Apilactobacillus ozensis DSM 23829 = JCM 17196 TaxID=1423781 RepID=A0A0R2B490_9LACO|nr:hypothetical protein [Apilactobacillus ozensis]KRM69900.1 hypothetical protein FD06_GL000066 [Apilactobacillus ozensis DSM 23829 = JCM 17196]MCK8606787.1 hypothetical protein [Apilactobacillus ozensis]
MINIKEKYEVHRYVGVPVETNSSGQYIIKKDDNGNYKFHNWRTGKHTKGNFKKLGQVFLTENNMMVAVIAVYDVKFNHRHEYTPLQRFTSEYVDKDLIIGLKKELNA